MLRINYVILCLITLFSIAYLTAQTPGWQWVQKAGGSGDDNSKIIATDNQGNVIVAGWFTDTAVFGNTTLTATGSMDLYLGKIDSSGIWQWVKQAGGTGSCEPFDVAVDNNDNIYLCGSFDGNASFGDFSLTTIGSTDVFVCKLDSDGNWIWAVRTGGNNMDVARAIDVDVDGNVYLAGDFWNTATIGHTVLTNPSMSQVFIAKMHTDGSWLWAQQAGGSSTDNCYAMTLDSGSNICIAGVFSQTATFGDSTFTSRGSYDIFVGKINPDGIWISSKQVGGNSNDYCTSITADTQGNIYIAGKCSWNSLFGDITIDFGGGFVAKLDDADEWEWAKKINGDGSFSYYVCADSFNNVLVTGSFLGVPYFGTTMLIPHAADDVFAAKIDPSGNWVWAIAAGSNGNDGGISITSDNAGNVYLTGVLQNTCEFGTISLTSSGMKDTFIAKIDANTPNTDDIAPEQLPIIMIKNYPNPFCKSTRIAISVDDNIMPYNLSVYDAKGRKVCTVFNGFLPKGESNFTWISDDKLPCGIYYYSISNGKSIVTKKMILMK